MAQMQIGPDLLLLLPALGGVVTGVLALVAAMFERPRWAFWITVLGQLVAGALAIPLLGRQETVFLGTYRIDALSTWAALVLLPATALVAALAEPEVRGTDRESAVYSLLAFTTTGALVLAGAGDLLLLVLGVLISSLGAFGLVAYRRDDRGTEAAMKYFVFGSVSEAVMIFGLTFWFGAAGSTLLADLGRLAGSRLPALAGMAGVLFGHYTQFLSTNDFQFIRSFEVIIMVVLGGMGSLTGSVFGAIVITLLPELLRSLGPKIESLIRAIGITEMPPAVHMFLNNLAAYRLVIYSALLILIMLTRPQGLLGTREFGLSWLKRAQRRPEGDTPVGDSKGPSIAEQGPASTIDHAKEVENR